MNKFKENIGLIIGGVIAILGFANVAFGLGVYLPYQGGTGTNVTPASGTVLIGNGTGTYTPAFLTAGSNITITNASGSVTIASTGGGSATATINSVAGPSFTFTGLSPLSISNLGTAFTWQVATATTAVNGILTSTDWNTFNNKVASTRQIICGTGIYGCGDFSADRTMRISQDVSTTSSVVFANVSSTGNVDVVGYIKINGDKVSTSTGGTPGGSDTQVQFNNGGSFGASSSLTYTSTTSRLSLNNVTSSVFIGSNLNFATSGIPAVASTSIAFDRASGSSVNPGTSLNWNASTTGSNVAIIVSCLAQNAGDNITAVSYGSVALTKLGFKGDSSTWGDSLWGLTGPPSGTNTISVSSSQNTAIFCSNSSYTGVSQINFPDSSSTKQSIVATFNATTTTVVDNSWLVMGVGGEDTPITAGTGTTLRNLASNQEAILDSNGAKSPPGAYSLQATVDTGSTTGEAAVIISIAPVQAVAANTTVFSTSTAALYVGGHIFTGFQNRATSSVSSCGTSPGIFGNDTAGEVVVGTGVVTSCKITFGQNFANPPACVANDDSSILAVRSQTTSSTLTISAASTFGGDTLSFICMDY